VGEIYFPDGTTLSELKAGGSSVKGSGNTNMVTKWISTNVVGNTGITSTSGLLSLNETAIDGINYIEGGAGLSVFRFFFDNASDWAFGIKASHNISKFDHHFGLNSGFIRDNSGDLEIHLASGKALKIVVG